MDLTTTHRAPAPGRSGGVCGGLARAWRLDPFLLRVAFVVLALGGGVGLVLYAALWLVMPAADTGRAVLDGTFPAWRRAPRALVVAAGVVAVLATSALLAPVLPFGIAPSLVLLTVWYVGMHRPARRAAERARERAALSTAPPRPFAEQTDFTRRAAAWQQRVHEQLGQSPADPTVEPRGELRTGAPGFPAYTGQPGYSLDAFLADPSVNF